MNPNGNFASFTIKPIQLISRSPPFNWVNSPKAYQSVRQAKQITSFQPRPPLNANLCVMKKQHNIVIQAASLQVRHSKNKSTVDRLEFKQPSKAQETKRGIEVNFYGSEKPNLSNKLSLQNLPPNVIQYEHMHKKLNVLEDKLSLMKQKLFKRKQLSKAQNFHDHWKNVTPKQQNELALKQIVSQINCNKNLKSFTYNPYTQGSEVYYVSEIVKAFKQENSLARDHLINSFNQLRALSKLRGPSNQQLQQKKLNLCKKQIYQGKKTVVFDLDQTLIHCNQNLTNPCDVKIKVKFPTGQIVEAGINIRPYALDILKNLSKNFQVVVFTASHSCYANEVLDYLDPQKQLISHRLFRQHCYQTPQGVYIKDLRVLGRELSEIVLIDNAAYSYALQIQNGIPIIPYYEGKADFELRALQQYLQQMASCKDVRDINRSTFKLNKYTQFDNFENLMKNLYYA